MIPSTRQTSWRPCSHSPGSRGQILPPVGPGSFPLDPGTVNPAFAPVPVVSPLLNWPSPGRSCVFICAFVARQSPSHLFLCFHLTQSSGRSRARWFPQETTSPGRRCYPPARKSGGSPWQTRRDLDRSEVMVMPAGNRSLDHGHRSGAGRPRYAVPRAVHDPGPASAAESRAGHIRRRDPRPLCTTTLEFSASGLLAAQWDGWPAMPTQRGGHGGPPPPPPVGWTLATVVFGGGLSGISAVFASAVRQFSRI